MPYNTLDDRLPKPADFESYHSVPPQFDMHAPAVAIITSGMDLPSMHDVLSGHILHTRTDEPRP